MAEKNKLQYLNLLAQYRLAKCVKEEIDHFLKGEGKSLASFMVIGPNKSFSNVLPEQSSLCISSMNHHHTQTLLLDDNLYMIIVLHVCMCV